MPRLSLAIILLAPSILPAQSPVRYRMISDVPRLMSSFDNGVSSHTLTLTRATALLTRSSRDSAGGVMLQFTADTAREEVVIADSSIAAKERIVEMDNRTSSSNAPRQAPPATYRVFLQQGRPLTTSTTRGNAPIKTISLDSINPFASLLAKLPGVGLLVANPALPEMVGSVRADTFASHTNASIGTIGSAASGMATALPPVDVYDTTVVVWRRISRDTLEGRVSRSGSRSSEASHGTSTAVGLYRIIFDDAKAIREASWSVTSTSISIQNANNRPPATSVATSSYSLVRIP